MQLHSKRYWIEISPHSLRVLSTFDKIHDFSCRKFSSQIILINYRYIVPVHILIVPIFMQTIHRFRRGSLAQKGDIVPQFVPHYSNAQLACGCHVTRSSSEVTRRLYSSTHGCTAAYFLKNKKNRSPVHVHTVDPGSESSFLA